MLDKVIFTWGSYTLNYRMILSVIIVLIVAKLILSILKFLIHKKFKNIHLDKSRLHSIYQLLRYFIWVIAIGLVLEQLGVKLTLLLAGSAALLVGLGLGLQQTFNDFISGVIILTEGSLKKNDIVEVDKLIGKVNEINIRTSEIITRDGIYIIVPNHKLVNENVINWSHQSRATRFKVNVGVAYSSDEELVKKVLFDCAHEEQGVLKNDDENHPIFVRIIDFGSSSIDFEMLFWSDEIFHIEQVKSNLRFKILKKFRENGIEIPFPQSDIHIKNT